MSPGISLITQTKLKEAPRGLLSSFLGACTIVSFITHSQTSPQKPIARHGSNTCGYSTLRVQIEAADQIRQRAGF